jgi:hypothetical protein
MDRNAFAGVEEFLSEIYIKVIERMKRNIYVQTDIQTDRFVEERYGDR